MRWSATDPDATLAEPFTATASEALTNAPRKTRKRQRPTGIRSTFSNARRPPNEGQPIPHASAPTALTRSVPFLPAGKAR
jgi:hypothetical protein